MKIARLSVRTRLTLWFAAALALLLTVFSVGVYTLVRAHLLQQMNAHLDKNLQAIADTLHAHPEEIDEHILSEFFAVHSGGDTIYTTPAWEFAQLQALATAPSDAIGPYWQEQVPYFIKSTQVQTADLTYAVVTAEAGTVLADTLASVRNTLAAGFVLALISALAGGYFLAARALKPARTLADAAENISAARLDARLPVENPRDEFGRLAGAFNRTLTRLADAFAQLHRFTADASHELRTPLTAIRSVGEAALAQPPHGGGDREAIGSMLEEVERLTHLVDSLLALARADRDAAVLDRRAFDLAGLVEEVAEFLRALAEEKHQRLVVDLAQRPTITADRPSVRQAVINVIHNALRYSPPHGEILVHLSVHDARAVLDVIDHGPGIAPEHRERIFERFYRIDNDRARDRGGAGLGLAIAQWAVGCNHGRITALPAAGGGACLRIELPVSRE